MGGAVWRQQGPRHPVRIIGLARRPEQCRLLPLAARACAKERSLVPRFTWMELATDPIIREVWDPQGTSRSVCE